jgi:hypothetical protein
VYARLCGSPFAADTVGDEAGEGGQSGDVGAREHLCGGIVEKCEVGFARHDCECSETGWF